MQLSLYVVFHPDLTLVTLRMCPFKQGTNSAGWPYMASFLVD